MQLTFTEAWTNPETGNDYPAGTVTSLDYDSATEAIRAGAALKGEHIDDAADPLDLTKHA